MNYLDVFWFLDNVPKALAEVVQTNVLVYSFVTLSVFVLFFIVHYCIFCRTQVKLFRDVITYGILSTIYPYNLVLLYIFLLVLLGVLFVEFILYISYYDKIIVA